jgi:sulfate adenylyltransferase subunit 1
MSIAIELEDDLDISRGDMIVKPNNQPEVNQDIDTMLCWFSPQPLKVGGKYVLRHTTAEVRTMIKDVVYKMDINELQKNENDKDVKMNDIARIKLRTTKPLFFDPYKKNRETGSLILVDEATNNTVAAGMIR